MGFSKVAQRVSNKLQAPISQANKILDKAPQILNTASNVLGKTGNVLNKVGTAAGKVLNNPITQAIVASQPELLPLYGGAIGASSMIKRAGGVADQASNATGQASQVLERSKGVVAQIPAVSFH